MFLESGQCPAVICRPIFFGNVQFPTGLQLHWSTIAQNGGEVEFFVELKVGVRVRGGLPGRQWSSLGFGVAVVFYEPGLVVAEEILDHLDSAEAGGYAFLLLEKAVVRERFPDLHDFDMPLLGFPKLAFGEGRKRGRDFFLHIYQSCTRASCRNSSHKTTLFASLFSRGRVARQIYLEGGP